MGTEAEKRGNRKVASKPAMAERVEGESGGGLPCLGLEALEGPSHPPLSSITLPRKRCHSHFTGGKEDSWSSDLFRATSSGSLRGLMMEPRFWEREGGGAVSGVLPGQLWGRGAGAQESGWAPSSCRRPLAQVPIQSPPSPRSAGPAVRTV